MSETKHTVEILDNRAHEDWGHDVVWDDDLEKMDSLARNMLHSCGWTDSDNEDNDEAVYAMIDVLFEHGKPPPPNVHPQSFDPGGVVGYEGSKFFCTAGPAIFASKDALIMLAKDAGVNWKDYVVK